MAEAVERSPVIVEGQVQFPDTPCGVCDERNNTGRGFLGLLIFSSVNIIPTSALFVYLIQLILTLKSVSS
jgi:hypothetical protein